jgi:hypothetical protein
MRRDPTRRGRRRRPRLAALGLGLALALTACGGSPDGEGVASLGGDRARNQADTTADGAAGTASKDPQQAAVDFARCMRKHGIDMPDPQVDEQGRVTMRIGPGPGGGQGAGPDPKKLQAAQQACGNPLGGGDGPGQIDPKARDAMLAYARCMRAKGVDMPDSTGDGMVLRRGEGPDPTSAEFEEADRACNHHLSTLGTPERASPEIRP